jgi:hypothetical protein
MWDCDSSEKEARAADIAMSRGLRADVSGEANMHKHLFMAFFRVVSLMRLEMQRG